jgi:hypothetical protein
MQVRPQALGWNLGKAFGGGSEVPVVGCAFSTTYRCNPRRCRPDKLEYLIG